MSLFGPFYVTNYGDPETDAKLDHVLTKLSRMEKRIMAQFSDIQSLITGLNDKTNAISARITRLIEQLSNSPTPEAINHATAELTVISDQLAAMGQDPANPLP